MKKVEFEKGMLYGEACFLLRVNGWSWTNMIANNLGINHFELKTIALSYNTIIFDGTLSTIIFKTEEDYNNMAEWVESILVMKEMSD